MVDSALASPRSPLPFAAPDSMPHAFVVLLGMHRSGTSILTRILAESGFFPGPEADLQPGNRWNPDGYFERRSVFRTNERILQMCGGCWHEPPDKMKLDAAACFDLLAPLLHPYRGRRRAVIKDPRMCLTFSAWRPLFDSSLKIVRIVRDREAVAHSLNRRNGFSLEKGRRLWDVYNRRADAAAAAESAVFRIRYEDLFSGRRPRVLGRLGAFLETDVSLEQVAGRLVDPSRCHFWSDTVRCGGQPAPVDAQSACRTAFGRARSGDLSGARQVLVEAMARFPEHATVRNDLGVIEYHTGAVEAAERRFQEALRLDPAHRKARENLAQLRTDGMDVRGGRTPSSKAGPAGDPWWMYPKFRTPAVRVLLMNFGHLLLNEIRGALRRLGHDCADFRVETAEMDRGRFERRLTDALRRFKPDFVLTVNHLGFDQEGTVTDLLTRLRIPFASWYVDSPHLILHHYERSRSPYLTLFMWDEDYVDIVRRCGFEHVEYLPLGVDEAQFNPVRSGRNPLRRLASDVAFVGNSMVHKVRSVLARNRLDGELLRRLDMVSEAFEQSDDLIVREMLARRFPDLAKELDRLEGPRAYGYETAVTWNATGRYRAEQVRQLAAYNPLIAGDDGWRRMLGEGVRLHPELNYYSQLPFFYNAVKVNFNATSRQMKNGVNQRVFDVPACRRLLLTDRTVQLEQMLDPGTEVLAYRSAEEIPALVERALTDGGLYQRVCEAGHRRVTAEHTYRHRLDRLVRTLQKRHG